MTGRPLTPTEIGMLRDLCRRLIAELMTASMAKSLAAKLGIDQATLETVLRPRIERQLAAIAANNSDTSGDN